MADYIGFDVSMTETAVSTRCEGMGPHFTGVFVGLYLAHLQSVFADSSDDAIQKIGDGDAEATTRFEVALLPVNHSVRCNAGVLRDNLLLNGERDVRRN